ncbi:SDR family oxidoreductase [Gordonia amicalis]|uniref:SDR family NAD(P)-dependent oxidoreductase n=1 Tax=Gordonia amicalis TaxID=89053 RepID=UPI00040C615D|nr:SDR family oxidoreductase [Gordonia amicalis]MCZ4653858.1 SDR family oxidoreductase [Gordonia amicalis]
MDLNLTGKRAVITGASRGIGLRIAETLVDEGVRVVIGARDVARLDAAAEALRERGGEVHPIAVDVSRPESAREFVASATAALGGLDILVSNASPGSVKGDDAWVTSARGDLQAFAILAEAARGELAASGSGAVVAISSTSALDVDFPSGPNSFGAIKAAVLHHASALARAWAGDGIRVNTVSPGPIEFPDGAWDHVRQSRPEVYENLKTRIPLGRLGSVDDIADAVAFLVSARAGFITGGNVVVDGGMLSRIQH